MATHNERQHFITNGPILDALYAAQRRHTLFPHLGESLPPLGTEKNEGNTAKTNAQRRAVVVGVSGGADSVCLLYALYSVRREWRLDLHVAHLDHSLRPDSPQDAAWVAGLATELGLPIHQARLAPDVLAHPPEGTEAAARRARYEFLCQTATTVTPHGQTPIVAVAHHRDDQAETVLMNFVRGSGITGLGGMTPVSILPGSSGAKAVRLVRPFLSVRRAEIHAELQRRGIAWREDATNTDERHLRNHIRRSILPALARINPNVHATLARNAELLAGDAARLAELDRKTLASIVCQSDPADLLDSLTPTADGTPPAAQRSPARRLVLNLDHFQELDWATRRGVLRCAFSLFPIEPRNAGYERIEKLLHALPPPGTAPGIAPGPHPLVNGLAWTFFPGQGRDPDQAPARLSLHHPQVLPWQPEHPHLTSPNSDTFPALPIPPSGALPTACGWTLYTRPLAVDELSPAWRAHMSAWEAYVDADRVFEPVLTTPRPGMRIAPLGMGGQTKTLGDLFTDAKVHPTLRPGWPIIQSRTDSGAPLVIWVCGLAVSHHARITPNTRRILHLAWRDANAGS